MNQDLDAVDELRPGTVLAGKYRVERVLGAGGMGVVVAAHHIQLAQNVAIKFLLPGALANKEAVARFAREAQAAVRIKSEHVARVSDVGTLPDGAPYMVMEYLEGKDLAEWLKAESALPVEQAVEFVLQACEAIAEAHSIGIVHRDLKPANLFVIRRRDGVQAVKVLDFGISKLTGSGVPGSDMTQTAAMMGSPLYMSPEQIQSSKDVDARTDIWALGVILYELVTGACPFMAETIPALVYQIMSGVPLPFQNRRPGLPNELESVVFKCLEKDRAKRFENVGELAVALLPLAPTRGRGSIDRISGVLREAGFSASRDQPPRSNLTEVIPSPAKATAPVASGAAVSGAQPAGTNPSVVSRAAGTDASWAGTSAGKAPASSSNKLAPALAAGALLVALCTAGGVLWSRSSHSELSAEAKSAALPLAAAAPSFSAAVPSPPSVMPTPAPIRVVTPEPSSSAMAKPNLPSPTVTPAKSFPSPTAVVHPHAAAAKSVAPPVASAATGWGGRL